MAILRAICPVVSLPTISMRAKKSASECASKTRINEVEEARAFSALQSKSPSLSEQVPFKDE